MRLKNILFVSLLFLVALAPAVQAADPGWPRTLWKDGSRMVIYQPQVDDWRNFRDLDWRMAVSLIPKGGKAAIGVVELHGRTVVDHESRIVLISAIAVEKVNFPSLEPAQAAKMEQLIKTFLPGTFTISLDRLAASVPKADDLQGVALNNEPPPIFISYEPAILLDIDGEPVRAAIPNTSLEYVVNTHWPLFYDTTASVYYLLAGEQWLKADNLQGPWEGALKLPPDMKSLPKDARWTGLKKYISPAKSGARPTQVFSSTVPAEIIIINGKPRFTGIPQTGLKYVENTTSYLFFHTPTGQYYYLTSGRWFRAGALAGPWAFATPDLPDDFARIPPTSPAAQVRASVPGTDEAKDAVLLARIPVTATVSAGAARDVTVVYAGTPEFAPIKGTMPTIYYAVNTPQKVIQVNDRYYLCFQGVWFVSAFPQGAWEVAGTVPPVIYTIPPSSPVYNVTYVIQTINPDGTVTASYTSGYTGVYVTHSSTTVVLTFGTGFYYPPYMLPYPVYGFPVYYPPPVTYGYVASYHTPAGAYGISQTAYGPYGSATRTSTYNPYTGTYARTASATTAYGSTFAGQAYNPYTGASGATRQGSNAYGSWGSSVVSRDGETAYMKHQTTAQGTTGSIQTTSGGKGAYKSGSSGKSAIGKTDSGDIYAGHDGNAYRKTGDGWQKYADGNWNDVQKPPQGSQRQLQQESSNRQRGEASNQRAQKFQRSGGRTRGGSGFGEERRR